MDIMIDSMKVLGRIVTILPLLLAVGLFMGKRSIGELPVFDFLVVLVLGSVVGADIADPEIKHFHTVVAMVAIALLQKLIVFIKLKNRKLGKLMTFEPIVVIHKGKFIDENMKKVQYTIDDVLEMLRDKDVFLVEDVQIGVVEADGQMSVKLKSENEPVTKGDLHIAKQQQDDFEVPVILDGEIQLDLLKRMRRDEAWIKQMLLKDHVVDVQDVFYGAITKTGNFHYSLKGKPSEDLPLIEH